MDSNMPEINFDSTYSKQLTSMLKELKSISISNKEKFNILKDPISSRFHENFHLLQEHLDLGVEPGVAYLLNVVHLYDFSPEILGNGYRSLLKIVEKCCIKLLSLSRYVFIHADSFLFRSDHYSREIEAYVSVLGQLRACIYYSAKFIAYCPEGDLIPDELYLSEEDFLLAQQILTEVEQLCQEAFYGRCLGFQFCESMITPLKTLNLVLASYYDGYSQSSSLMKFASSVINSSKYINNPELRAQRVVEATTGKDITFCKSFWSLNENQFLHKLPAVVCPSIAVEKVFKLDPIALTMISDEGNNICIEPPKSYMGSAPVLVRLISHTNRTEKVRGSSNLCDGLILQFHGGGFVAQSSASHQVYLRHWARDTDVPILSVDYSLAPEHPYPRQLEECYFAYCWALNNSEKLGTTAKRVVVVGDSAGGNLAMAISLKCAENGIRVPDGILSVYGCFLIRYTPTPSRILSIMDPLLPLGILPQCLEAYAGKSHELTYNGAEVNNSNSKTKDLTESSNNLNRYISTRIIDSDDPDMILSNESFDDNKTMDSGFMDTEETKKHEEGLHKELNGIVNSEINSSDKGVAEKTHCDLKHKRVQSEGNMRLWNNVRPHNLSIRIPPQSKSIDIPSNSRTSPYEEYSTASFKTPTYAKMRHFAQSPQLRSMTLSKNRDHFLSPIFASDRLLSKMKNVSLITCDMDPLLDDSVAMARRLRNLNCPVTLDIVEGLPHGFLNFVLISNDAMKASVLCVQRLISLLKK